MKHRHAERGYTLAEMVVVVAIIGLLSLAAVPNFLALYRQNQIRNAVRTFSSDARFARMNAIKNQHPTKISFSGSEYNMQQVVAGAWVNVRQKGQELRPLTFPAGVSFAGTTLEDIEDVGVTTVVPADTDAYPDLVYLPNGAAWRLTEAETIRVTTSYDCAKPNYTVTARPSGNLKVNEY